MKKRYSLTLSDISLIEVADFLIAFWIVGLFLTASKTTVANFFIEWKWAFFAVAIIIGIKPVWRMIYGPHSDEANPVSKKVSRKKVRKKKR